MILLALATAALAGEPIGVVAIGDALVNAAPAPAPSSATATSTTAGSVSMDRDDPPPTGGWVAVLADCLDERAAGRFGVVDRASGGGAPAALLGLDAALGADPRMVVAAFGPPREDVKVFRGEVEQIVNGVISQGRRIVLVGVVDPTGKHDAADVLASVASAHPGVLHVDPKFAAGELAGLVGADGALTDPGHARVGAAVCDALLALPR